MRKVLKRNFIFPACIILSMLLFACGSTHRLRKNLETNFKSAPFENHFTGFALYDVATGKMLYSKNAEKNFIPASNMKLFTFYGALKILGDSIPALKYKISQDSLIFKGTGDPSFLNSNLAHSNVLQFLKNSKKHLYYCTPYFVEEKFGPGWSWDDYNYAFSAERAAFPIYGNTVHVSAKNSSEKIKISPSYFQDLFFEKSHQKEEVTRDPDANIFYFHRKKDSLVTSIPFVYSNTLFVEMLSDTLKKPIKIISNQDIEFPQTLYSISADSLYREMLQESDNFVAEQLLLVIAGKVSDTLSSQIGIDYIGENYLQDIPDKPRWVDGSGLSRYNLSTPRSLIFLLNKIYKKIPQPRLFELFPAGGKSGTLKNLFQHKATFVFAKSGSLSNNYSLSGYLKTSHGKVLIFSIMNNNFTQDSSEIKKGIENILKEIYLKY